MTRDVKSNLAISVWTLAVGVGVWLSVGLDVSKSRDETVRNRSVGSQIDDRAERIERQLCEVLKRLPATRPTP